MNGKTHKAIGVATGVSLTIYGATAGIPLLALGMLTAPIGAMLPDIDHNNTKIGRKRKNVIDFLSEFIKLTVGVVVIFTICLGFINGALIPILLKILFVIGSLALCMFLASNPTIKKKCKFFTKHRGIMHTLLLPVCLLIGSLMLNIEVVTALCIGLILGYISHLLADTCTIMGCPLLWPLTENCIHILPIRTGTIMEYIVGAILAGGIICLGCCMGH